MGIVQRISNYFARPKGSAEETVGRSGTSDNQTQTIPISDQSLALKSSYTNDDLFNLYLDDDLIRDGVDRPVDSAFSNGLTPEVKAPIIEEMTLAHKWARVTGTAVVVKTAPGTPMAVHQYNSQLGWGFEFYSRSEPGAWDEWGQPIKIQVVIGNSDSPIRKPVGKENFTIIRDAKGVGGYQGDPVLRRVARKADIMDKMLKNFAEFGLINALGFLGFKCKGTAGVNAVIANFKDPKAVHFFPFDQQHIEEAKWVGPGGSTFDPMPAILYIESRIARHFALDKLSGQAKTNAATAGQVDFYAVVKEKQRLWLPQVRKVLEMLGFESCIERKEDEPDTKFTIDDVWFNDPTEASPAQKMATVQTVAQTANALSAKKEGALKVINNLTGWNLEYDEEADKQKQQQALQVNPNEPNRQRANAQAEDSSKEKERAKSASNT